MCLFNSKIISYNCSLKLHTMFLFTYLINFRYFNQLLLITKVKNYSKKQSKSTSNSKTISILHSIHLHHYHNLFINHVKFKTIDHLLIHSIKIFMDVLNHSLKLLVCLKMFDLVFVRSWLDLTIMFYFMSWNFEYFHFIRKFLIHGLVRVV